MLFKAKPPVSTYTKVNIEHDIQWLVDHLGITHLDQWPIRLPGDSQINLREFHEKSDVEPLRDRIAQIFHVKPSIVSIEFGFIDDGFETCITHGEQGIIAQIQEDLVEDPTRVASHLINCFSAAMLAEQLGPSKL